MRTPHSSTNKGKRVKITLRSGTVILGKFNDKKSGTIILESPSYFSQGGTFEINQKNHDEWNIPGFEYKSKIRIPMKDVRAFSIYKPTCTQTK